MNVFVYGTLMKKERAHFQFLSSSSFVGEGVIEGYDLFDTGQGYPGIQKGTGVVLGEVYQIDECTLSNLDIYENIDTGLYRREATEVLLSSGQRVVCFVYLYQSEAPIPTAGQIGISWHQHSTDFVWYVSYGSNLSLERLKCYVTGEGSSSFQIDPNPVYRCRNSSDPVMWRKVLLPFSLYFAGQSLGWDGGGTAFLDPAQSGETIGRAYLLTREQYSHIKALEGPRYQTQLHLDPIEGVPAFSFTHGNRLNDNAPFPRYLSAMKAGFLEMGLSEIEIETYLLKLLASH